MDVDGGAERAEVRVSTAILKTYILAQHMAVSFVDKADHRVKTIHVWSSECLSLSLSILIIIVIIANNHTQSIIAVLEVLPPQLQHRFTLWVSILGNNPKNGIRAFAVELSEAMLLGGAFEVSAGMLEK